MIKSEKEKLLELIDDQIAYWNKLKCESTELAHKNECQHEPDSQKHLFGDEGGNFFMNRCKHCKGFYK